MKNQTKRRFSTWDPWILVPFLSLCVLGVVMVYSASAVVRYQSESGPFSYLFKQAFFVVLGLFVFMYVSSVDIKMFRSPGLLKYFAMAMFLSLIGVKLFGASINGAQGWINIGGAFSIQPAEVCKLFLILYLASLFTDYREHPKSFSKYAYAFPLTVAAVLIVLIVIQPDLGGAAINSVIVLILFLSAKTKWKGGVTVLVSVFLGVVFGMPFVSELAVKYIHGYKAARFVGYLNPFGSASGAGSQLVNSYYAISNGGLFGKGLGNSIQKMGYLPEPNTDFILAVIAEELGLITVILILLGLGIIVCRTIQIGARATNQYDTLICYGVATFILVEASFNIGAVCGLLPITGVTLPFISYGGSSMLVLCFALGLVFNVSRRQRVRRSAQ
ncbi:FtsW/RodA/SpoVE family cell cycle protein [Limosilactobacillus fermentum]|uniref:FtsW/RodA/SpoVE family cell cycle protein n=1 Tax=Limosilactobacillus fermentum TaxID=1613 RepID=UPI0021A725A5|nr:FtsW/RodA/SpoVE family cell cycle protein [Limosilactobacillus fermentum]MCT2917256.1 FtsW/RodA/SpoVE family cell cycle protein [Limosilactobacillus fermentum]